MCNMKALSLLVRKVTDFVHASNADADVDVDVNADTRAMTLAPRTFVLAR